MVSANFLMAIGFTTETLAVEVQEPASHEKNFKMDIANPDRAKKVINEDLNSRTLDSLRYPVL